MELTNQNKIKITKTLETLTNKSEKLKQHAKEKDPIGLVYGYKTNVDIEAAAFITSTLSYGKQSVFRPIIGQLLSILGQSPVDFILHGNIDLVEGPFNWFKYRFNGPIDIYCLLISLRNIYIQNKTLEQIFLEGYKNNIKEGCQHLVNSILINIPDHKNLKGFNYLLPNPSKGSACKRLNMFLRWMIREDEIDLGIWKNIPKNKLIIPLDTHVARISKEIGLTNKKGNSWEVAEDITDSLLQIDPTDPIRFDFPICTAGILNEI